jgi:hypothetical protein
MDKSVSIMTTDNVRTETELTPRIVYNENITDSGLCPVSCVLPCGIAYKHYTPILFPTGFIR